MAENPRSLLSAAAITTMPERKFQHMFNANGIRMTRSLSDACGLRQLGVHLVRVEPGRESTEYHTHSHDEEWIYILSGRASAQIGERTLEVKAGDFMGFVAGSEPHTMKNESSEDLVYLVGGTRHGYDVVDYPRRGIRSYKYDGRRDNVETKKLGVG
ncbi:MAG: cupin domain-containing protein [Burkholderiales bacterium]|nr:cupin domain-containing protein [Burkholderiales bacterium]